MSEMKKLLMLMEDAEEKSKKEKDEDLSRASIAGTGEEQEILAYIRKHYPEAPNTQAAFIKFVINSLENYKVDHEQQERKIQELEKEVQDLKRAMGSEEELFEPDSPAQNNSEQNQAGT